jgi:Lon protease-like protein
VLESVTKLPLLALPETVVFQGMTLPLHIFEERYKKLVRDCIEQEQRRFIVVLSKARAEIRDTEFSTHAVGAFVDILSATENVDGTYSIVVHGQERCRVDIVERISVQERDGTTSDLPYSNVVPYPIERLDPNLERVAAWDALETFREYARSFFEPDMIPQIEEALPEELVYQASFICANMRVPVESRQVLLESPSLVARFQLAQKLMLEHLALHED